MHTLFLFNSFRTGKSISSVLARDHPSFSKVNVHNVKVKEANYTKMQTRGHVTYMTQTERKRKCKNKTFLGSSKPKMYLGAFALEAFLPYIFTF